MWICEIFKNHLEFTKGSKKAIYTRNSLIMTGNFELNQNVTSRDIGTIKKKFQPVIHEFLCLGKNPKEVEEMPILAIDEEMNPVKAAFSIVFFDTIEEEKGEAQEKFISMYHAYKHLVNTKYHHFNRFIAYIDKKFESCL